MSLEFTCPCGRALQVGAELAGKRVRCPACRMIVWAPVEDVPVAQLAPDAEPQVVDPPAPPPPPKFRLGPPETQSPPRTALSRAANAIAVAGFIVFGLALIAVAFRPGAGPGRPLLLGAAAFFLVVAGSTGASGSMTPAPAPASAAPGAPPAAPPARVRAGPFLVFFAALFIFTGFAVALRRPSVRYAGFECEERLRVAAESIDGWQRVHDGTMPASVRAIPAAQGAFTCPSGLPYVYERHGNFATLHCPKHTHSSWRITPDDPR